MIHRLQAPSIANSKKSIMLLGPRQVGKSTLINSLPIDFKFNLADEQVFLDIASDPSYLRDALARGNGKNVFIDEVQRLPSLLNTVQSLIDEDKKLRFFLTGSSARKLKRGGANLLPGRVINYSLGPIIAQELNYECIVENALRYGFLPEVLTLASATEKEELLLSYGANYIREEIQAESLVRSLESFSRFLTVACAQVGHFIDYTKVAKAAKISRHSCPNFFEILEDTLVAFRIGPSPELTEKFDLVKHPKLFFFDVGALNGLEKSFDISSRKIGALLEQVVFQQIFHSARALKKNFSLHTFRTRGGLEVDFNFRLDEKDHFIEVKASPNPSDQDVASLKRIRAEMPNGEFYLFHSGSRATKINGIWSLPVFEGIKELGL